MKKILFAFLILTFISCSNDSISDISETTENNTEDNNDDSNNENNNGEDSNGEDNNTKVTFTKDILPIINNKCSSCHVSGGSQTNYTIYSATNNNANSIINRINRNQGTNGFMPQNGTKLSATELAKFDQWITDGKLE